MKALLSVCFFLFLQSISAQVTIVSENMGSPSATTSIAANTFQQSYTYSGTADVRITQQSTGYTGASGNGNVFFTNTTGRDFVISGINTSGYTSLTLSFGQYKSLTSGNNELVCEVSSDGITYSPLSYSRATTTATWEYVTASGSIPAVANLRIRFRQTSNSIQFRLDDLKLTGILTSPCTPGAAPTTPASSVTTSPSCTTTGLSLVAGNGNKRLILLGTSPIATNPTNGTAYSASANFGSGAAIGSAFVIYNGTGNALSITGLTAGTQYYFAIYEYNVATTGCSESYESSGFASGNFTTLTGCAATTPQVHDILADVCGSNEGRDEIVMFKNGSSPLSIANISVTFPTTSVPTYCNSGCGASTLLNNAGYVSSLNSTAGCPVFVYADPIPASAEVVLFTGHPPTAVLNYSNLCATAQQYYVIFCNNPTDVTGRFANSGATAKTLTMNFNGVAETVSYIPDNLTGDGSFAHFDDAGNVSYFSIPGCQFPLGVELLFLNAEVADRSVMLSWSTQSEKNAAYFAVERADSHGMFSTVGLVNCTGTSSSTQYYQYKDDNPETGLAYYRLKQIDLDGETTFSQIVSVQPQTASEKLFYNQTAGLLTFPEELLPGSEVQVMTVTGELALVLPVEIRTNTAQARLAISGVYLVSYTNIHGQQCTAKVAVY